MANPQYPMQPPQMQQQQPMGQMPPQAAPPPQPKQAKGGTSKMVPIVVSAGLAVGTFCGLLFGVGTGEAADASPSSGNNVKSPDPSETAPVTPTKPSTTSAVTPAKPSTTVAVTPAAGSAAPAAGSAAGSASGSATVAAAGSAAPAAGSAAPAAGSGATPTVAAGSGATPAAGTTPPAAGSGAGSAKPTVAEPAAKKPKLTVELMPESVAATAKITVDGKPIEGNSIEIDLGKDAKKEVKIVVKANGYKTVEQKVDVDSDVAVKIELIKRASTPTGPRPGGPVTPPKKKTGGGLIDI